jgi:hypothetical protein
VIFQVGLQPARVIFATWARKAFSTPSKSLVLSWHIL